MKEVVLRVVCNGRSTATRPDGRGPQLLAEARRSLGVEVPIPMSFYLPTATYRTTDPVDNLRLRVELRKTGTLRRAAPLTQEEGLGPGKEGTAAAAARPRRRRERDKEERAGRDSDSDDEAGTGTDDEAEEGGRALLPPPAKGLRSEEDEPDRLIASTDFAWQQKVFGTLEVARIRRGGSPGQPQSRSGRRPDNIRQAVERDTLAALDAEAQTRGDGAYEGQLLYSRVQSEGLADESTLESRFTTSSNEVCSATSRDQSCCLKHASWPSASATGLLSRSPTVSAAAGYLNYPARLLSPEARTPPLPGLDVSR